MPGVDDRKEILPIPPLREVPEKEVDIEVGLEQLQPVQPKVEAEIGKLIVWRKAPTPGQAIGKGTGIRDGTLPNIIHRYGISWPEPGSSNQLMVQIDFQTRLCFKGKLTRPVLPIVLNRIFNLCNIGQAVWYQVVL